MVALDITMLWLDNPSSPSYTPRMEFHVFNIDQRSESEVNLYGRLLTGTDTSMKTIRVTGIFSPIYFLPTAGREEELLSEIRAFMDWNRTEGDHEQKKTRPTTTILTTEKVTRQNIFHKSLGRHLELIKITFSRNINFTRFDSEYCEMLFTEFQSPVENLVISKKIMGPGVLELEGVVRDTVEFKNLRFLRNAKLPLLKTSAIAVTMAGGDIREFAYYNKNTGQCISRTQTDSRALEEVIRKDAPDLLVFHNLHSRARVIPRDKIACDVFSFAQGAIKGRDYSIQELCTICRVDKKPGLEGDARALIDIADSMNIVGLAKELAEIGGYLLNRCLGNSRAERIEFMLMHELYARDFLFPAVMNRTNTKFAGGLVLEPLRGFYEEMVLLLDFNSLYPSIIQEFDVCFSTIGRLLDEDGMSLEACLSVRPGHRTGGTPAGTPTPACTGDDRSFLPGILKGLVSRRKAVKDLVRTTKSPEEREILEIRQKALKLTANSIYGCLGCPGSRFCNFDMAAFITAKGRELLNETKKAADEMGMRVIYGDTDSIMIQTKGEDYGRAAEAARHLVEKINGRYRNIEIELEKVFKRLLLYTKKRYAALVLEGGETYIETKGLDVVRRDFCRASTELGRAVLDIILRDRDKGVRNNTNETAEMIYGLCTQFYATLFTRPADDFVVSTVLSKDASAYATALNQPHISLAMRLQAKGIPCYQDDVISYVIGKGEGPVSARAFHPDEKFDIDYDYYIKHQILPPLYRLVSLLTFVSTTKISTIFGILDFKPACDTLMLSMPCCQHVQAPALSCGRCQAPVPAQFYIETVSLRLHQAVSNLYRERSRCVECGVEYSNHLQRCFACQRDLVYEPKNEEFNNSLNAIDAAFKKVEIPEISELVGLYSENSSYRVIDLSKYF